MSEDGPFLFEAYGNPDNDEGNWVVYQKEGDIQFRVRQIPDKVDAQMQKKVTGRRIQTVKFRRGVSESDVDLDESAALAVERARYALLDSKNLKIVARDEEGASDITKALGAPVKIGEQVCLDGHWTQAVKDYVFERFGGLCPWIVEASNRQRMRSSEEEQALAGN